VVRASAPPRSYGWPTWPASPPPWSPASRSP